MIGEPGAYLFGLLAASIWALAGVIAKRGLTNGGSALLFALLSALVGTVLFWGVLVVQRGAELFAHLTPSVVAVFALAGLVSSCIGRVLHFVGIDHVGATVAQTCVTTYPMFAVLLALLVIGESIRLVELFGMLVIVIGLVVLSLSKGGDIGGWRGWELLIPISAALLFGIGDVVRRYGFLATEATPIEGTALNSLAALTGFVSYVLVTEKRDVIRVPRRAYRYVVVAALLTPLGLLSLMTGLSLGRVIVVAPLAGTTPLFTIVFGYLLIRDLERITGGIVVGSVFIVLGIYLITGV